MMLACGLLEVSNWQRMGFMSVQGRQLFQTNRSGVGPGVKDISPGRDDLRGLKVMVVLIDLSWVGVWGLDT